MKDFYKAVEEGKQFVMKKYLSCGKWSTPQIVSAKRAMAKAKVRTEDGYCPYSFEIAK